MRLGRPTGGIASVLRLRDVRLLLGAGLISQTGDWILGAGLAYQVFAVTGSTVASAVTLLLTQAPQVVLGPLAGAAVDRLDRRRVLLVAQLAFAVALLPLLFVHGAAELGIVYAVVAVTSCIAPFSSTAETALLPALVDEHDLVTANALNGQVRTVARLIGAALGGVIGAVAGFTGLALADIATFGLAALLIAVIRHRGTAVDTAEATGRRLRPLRDAIEGLAAIGKSRVLRILLIVFVLSGIGEAAMGTLFAPFVRDDLHGSGAAYGAILSAQAVGGILGGAVVAALGARVSARLLLGVGALVFGLGDAVLFLSPLVGAGPLPAAVVIAAVGLPGAALSAGLLTLFQLATGDRMRARVIGSLTAASSAAMLLSTVAAGPLAARLGVIPVICAQAVVYLLAGAVALLALPRPEPAPETASATAGEPASELAPARAELALDIPGPSIMLPTMPLPSNVRLSTISDPLAMRALAHPTRVALQSLVAREGTLTAADAARQLGISHALASHHLRQLAKYGFIEPAAAGDQREHPWRVTATDTALLRADPEARSTADVLDLHAAERAVRDLTAWQQRREGDEWVDSTGVQASLLYLTADELDELIAAWGDLVLPLARRRPVGHPEDRPAGAVPVSLTLVVAPLEPTETGG